MQVVVNLLSSEGPSSYFGNGYILFWQNACRWDTADTILFPSIFKFSRRLRKKTFKYIRKRYQSHPNVNQSIKHLLGNFIKAYNISIVQNHQHSFRSSSFWFLFACTISTYFEDRYHCTYENIFRIKCNIHWKLNVISPICMWAKGRKTLKEHSAWMNSLHNKEISTNSLPFSWTESDSLKFLPLQNCPVC